MTTDRQPSLGVHLLETITRGMYSEPFHCIREYIQNAYDSIREARRNGLISADDGQILLTIDEMTRKLSIRDEGTGLSPESAAVHLLDIGKSDRLVQIRKLMKTPASEESGDWLESAIARHFDLRPHVETAGSVSSSSTLPESTD